MKKAVFLDRDGVINENGPRIDSPEKLKLIPGAAEAIQKLNQAGYLVIIVTNQPEIAKGFFGFEELEIVHKHLRAILEKKGAHIDAIYVCPHHPEKGFSGEVPELKIKCSCRKPEPGMILKAIAEFDINTKESWLVGDSKTDIIAGQKVGLMTILLTGGGGSGSSQEDDLVCNPSFEMRTLSEAVSMILNV